jgi:predicted anti-sigma-YlaC factor YlaD
VLLHRLLCPACRRYFVQMRVIVRMLRVRRRPRPLPRVESNVLARLSAGGDSQPNGRRAGVRAQLTDLNAA